MKRTSQNKIKMMLRGTDKLITFTRELSLVLTITNTAILLLAYVLIKKNILLILDYIKLGCNIALIMWHMLHACYHLASKIKSYKCGITCQ